MIDQSQLTMLRDFAESNLKRVAQTGGGEWAGPCPFCGGTDRFNVQPFADNGGRWLCRGCSDGWQDTITFVMKDRKLPETKAGYAEACSILGLSRNGSSETYNPPNAPAPAKTTRTHAARKSERWRRRAADFVAYAERTLWDEKGAAGLAYLRWRRLADETIRAARLGWNPSALYVKPDEFGLDRKKAVWIPAGLVIPHFTDGMLSGVRFRPNPPNGDFKYVWLTGSAPGMYRGNDLAIGAKVVIVEGEIDALTLAQECDDLITSVATAGITGGRGARWEVSLALADCVYVAFDSETNPKTRAEVAKHAAHWLQFPNARRLLPTHHDVNEMHMAGDSVREWIARALVVSISQSESESVVVSVTRSPTASSMQRRTIPSDVLKRLEFQKILDYCADR